MTDWQPIETAPKGEDDMILLLSFSHIEDYDASITVGFWGPRNSFMGSPDFAWCDWCAGMDDFDTWETVSPTHWMPLPPPPGE